MEEKNNTVSFPNRCKLFLKTDLLIAYRCNANAACFRHLFYTRSSLHINFKLQKHTGGKTSTLDGISGRADPQIAAWYLETIIKDE